MFPVWGRQEEATQRCCVHKMHTSQPQLPAYSSQLGRLVPSSPTHLLLVHLLGPSPWFTFCPLPGVLLSSQVSTACSLGVSPLILQGQPCLTSEVSLSSHSTLLSTASRFCCDFKDAPGDGPCDRRAGKTDAQQRMPKETLTDFSYAPQPLPALPTV